MENEIIPSNKRISVFEGSTLQLIGLSILLSIISLITLGIAMPWLICMYISWIVEKTVISGRKYAFFGKGLNLLGNILKWVILTIITFGIYGFFVPIKIIKWVVQNIEEI